MTEADIGSMGRMHGGSLVIQVANDLDPQQTQSTLIHEIIEAINFHLQLRIRHEVVSALETGIYQTLVNNGVDLSPLLKEEEEE
jgi:hypothetical protein